MGNKQPELPGDDRVVLASFCADGRRHGVVQAVQIITSSALLLATGKGKKLHAATSIGQIHDYQEVPKVLALASAKLNE